MLVATSPNYLDSSPVLQRYRHKTTVIPIGLDPSSYPQPSAETVERVASTYGRDFFLFVGVLRYYKGLEILLEAARDPELLRWVDATLLESTLLAYGRLVGPLSRGEQDRYCAETAWIGPLLGVPAERLPRDTEQLRRYMGEMRASGRIVVGPTGRMLGRALFESEPGAAGLQLRPVSRTARAPTVASRGSRCRLRRVA